MHNPSPSERIRRQREEMSRQTRRWGIGFAIWFAFCAVIGLGFLGLIAWAVISLVSWITSQ